MLIRGYRNTQWRLIDVSKLDLSKAQAWPIEDGSLGINDVTAQGTAAPSIVTAPEGGEEGSAIAV